MGRRREVERKRREKKGWRGMGEREKGMELEE